jgi:4'-phosphopantetheinyl transferase
VAHLWIADLDHASVDTSALSTDESERARRFKAPLHQKRFARGRSLVRHLAGRYLRCDPGEIRFGYGAAGKPRILHPATPALHFNVAHSEATILIAFSLDAELGVDVERLRTLPDEAELVTRFFHPDEIASYHALPPSLRSRGFANAWTRKEAVLKACGEGLQGGLDSFSVSLDPDESCRLRVPPFNEGRPVQWSLCAPEIGGGIAAALAAMGPLQGLRVQAFGARTSALYCIPQPD